MIHTIKIAKYFTILFLILSLFSACKKKAATKQSSHGKETPSKPKPKPKHPTPKTAEVINIDDVDLAVDYNGEVTPIFPKKPFETIPYNFDYTFEEIWSTDTDKQPHKQGEYTSKIGNVVYRHFDFSKFTKHNGKLRLTLKAECPRSFKPPCHDKILNIEAHGFEGPKKVVNGFSNSQNAGNFHADKLLGFLTLSGKIFTYGDKPKPELKKKIDKQVFKSLNGTTDSFAGITNQGKVMTWGYYNTTNGQKPIITAVQQSELDNVTVTSIANTGEAYAAITNDGKVITWGAKEYGGVIPDKIQTLLNANLPIKSITSGQKSFAALTTNGKVIVWGPSIDPNNEYGGNQTWLPPEIQPGGDTNIVVNRISSSDRIFAALTTAGKLFLWGKLSSIHATTIPDLNKTEATQQVYLTTGAVLVITDKGVHAYGPRDDGGEIPDEISNKLTSDNIISVFSNTSGAFAVLTDKNKVFAWGNSKYGGTITDDIQKALDGHATMPLYGNGRVFATLTKEGYVITWGSNEPDEAGKHGSIDHSQQNELDKYAIDSIHGIQDGFAAFTKGGYVVVWGDLHTKGYSDHVLPIIPHFVKYTTFTK